MSVFSVALTAAERLFCTSVLIATVLDAPAFVASVGVVTHVPYQVTCSGSVDDDEHVSIETALERVIARDAAGSGRSSCCSAGRPRRCRRPGWPT